MKESEVIQIAGECGFSVNKAEALKLEASGRQYHRVQLDSGETKVLCYLNPDKGTHTKFLHISNLTVLPLLRPRDYCRLRGRDCDEVFGSSTDRRRSYGHEQCGM